MGRLLSKLKQKHAHRMQTKPGLRKFVTGLKTIGDIATDFIPGGSAIKATKVAAKTIKAAKRAKLLKSNLNIQNLKKSSLKKLKASPVGGTLSDLGNSLRQNVQNEMNTLTNHANAIREGASQYVGFNERFGIPSSRYFDQLQENASRNLPFRFPQRGHANYGTGTIANGVQPPQFLPILNNY